MILHINYLIFFFNDTATTEIYTLSLHDALPISTTAGPCRKEACSAVADPATLGRCRRRSRSSARRSEEHTSELQSQSNLVCRLLLEKKKKKNNLDHHTIVESRTPYHESSSHVIH